LAERGDIMSDTYDFDLVVLGAGPGGYVGAIRASQLGLKCAVIEKDKPGGVCLNIGCIPSKALIHQAETYMHRGDLVEMGIALDESAFDYGPVFKKSRNAADTLSKGVRYLLKKNKVEYIEGAAVLSGPHSVTVGGDRTITGRNIMIATGSRPREIPIFPFDGKKVLSSTDALMLEKLPKTLLILGGGYIGMEFAHIMSSFGVQVTVVEMLDRILPLADQDVVNVFRKNIEKRGVRILTSTKAEKMNLTATGVDLTIRSPEGNAEVLSADAMIVSVGRSTNIENIGLEGLSIKTERGFILVDEHYRTNVPSIFAVGDVINTPQLAHVAMKEAELAAEFMAGKTNHGKLDPATVPAAIFTEPQIASFGPTEAQLEASGRTYKKASFPYRGAGKSVAIERSEGMVKLLYDDTKGNRLIAAHVVGADAAEIIHELILAHHADLPLADVAEMVHIHPTLSEAIMEAGRTAEGWAVHI